MPQRQIPGARKVVIACTCCAGLLVGLTGCGAKSSTAPPTQITQASASTRAAWASKTQQLCGQKRAAIAQLGSVHITYGGIARVGLPTVKRSLDAYLGRLLAVLRDFSQRQRQVATPPSVASAMDMAAQLDRDSQAATTRLQDAVASVRTPAELGAAFRTWTAALRVLAARGDALAAQLNLPQCRSGLAPA